MWPLLGEQGVGCLAGAVEGGGGRTRVGVAAAAVAVEAVLGPARAEGAGDLGEVDAVQIGTEGVELALCVEG